MSKKNSIVLKRKDCFSNSEQLSEIYSDFTKKILKLKARKFLVAVSGGSDSLALAAMCRAMHLNYKKIKFFYIHINHGIRKKSLSESKEVKKILKKQNILLRVVNNKKKIINNIQHNARQVRYSLLDKECKKKKIKFILTGHHKDDQIETFLLSGCLRFVTEDQEVPFGPDLHRCKLTNTIHISYHKLINNTYQKLHFW